MTPFLKTAALAAVFLLGGCAASNTSLSPQEQVFRGAQQSCTDQTNAMIGGSPYSWHGDLPWSSYFEWCMEGKGYTKDQLKNLWY